MFEALRRIELQQLAALANAPLDALQVFRVAIAQLRGLAGDGLGFLSVLIKPAFHAGGGPLLPLARAPPRTPGDSFQAIDPSQFLGLGRVNGDDRRCKPFFFQRMNVLGDTLLRDAELAADLPLAQASEIHPGDALAALEDAKPLLGIPTRHSLPA